MATSIVHELRLKISGKEKHKIAVKPIDNAAAYECYLRADYELSRLTEDGLDRAVKYLQNGIDIIGDNALSIHIRGLPALSPCLTNEKRIWIGWKMRSIAASSITRSLQRKIPSSKTSAARSASRYS